MTLRELVIGQVTSGRWLLTVASAVALLAMVRADLIAIEQGKAPPISVEAIFTIITMVFVSYFSKPTEAGKNGNGNGNGNGDLSILSKPIPPVPPV